jgi:hypothetical protein
MTRSSLASETVGHHLPISVRPFDGTISCIGLGGAKNALAVADIGQEVPQGDQQSPEALGAYHKAEIEKWWPIIKAANVKAE